MLFCPARFRDTCCIIAMEPCDRLEDLVAKARGVFESKHGSSEGCFAAYSPAKVVSALDDRENWPSPFSCFLFVCRLQYLLKCEIHV